VVLILCTPVQTYNPIHSAEVMKKKADSPEQVWLAVSLNINAAESPALLNQINIYSWTGRTSGDSRFGFFDIAAIQTNTKKIRFSIR
jgi:hypothetical protein